jgi:hypothetical protein
MAKSKKSAGVKVEPCVCSKCGQKSNAAPHSQHAYCRGFAILKPLPPMFANLRKPVKGTWVPVSLSSGMTRHIVTNG